jgi:hypothetical protein
MRCGIFMPAVVHIIETDGRGFVETIDYYSKVGYSVGIVGYTPE